MSNNEENNSIRASVEKWLNEEGQPDTLTLLTELFKAISEKHVLKLRSNFTGYFPYFPAPQVGHILRQLHSLQPDRSDRFTPLHIVCHDIDVGNREAISKNLFTVWLPKLSKGVEATKLKKLSDSIIKEDNHDDELHIWKDCGETWQNNPELLIARYVAAMVIGRAVSFAPREIGLSYYSKEARDIWGILIDRAIRENGGHVMQAYTTMINCKPSRFYRYEILPTHAETETRTEDFLKKAKADHSDENKLPNSQFPDDKYILGIDIGGTAVKVYKFTLKGLVGLKNGTPDAVESEEKTDDSTDAVKLNINVKDLVNSYDANDFLNKLFTQIENDSTLLQNCVAVGFSLAAPIDNSTGLPTASSNALGTYFNAETEIIKTNPLDLHRINLKKALEQWLKAKSYGQMVVTVLNDGDADIKDSSDTRSQLKEGVSVVVKAGTGVAVAVFQDGKLVEYKAESSKVILNLLSTVQPQNKPKQSVFVFKDSELFELKAEKSKFVLAILKENQPQEDNEQQKSIYVFHDNNLIKCNENTAAKISDLLANVTPLTKIQRQKNEQMPKPIGERFQQGVLSDFCSKKALIGFMAKLKSKEEKYDDDGKVINELLRQGLGIAFQESEDSKNILVLGKNAAEKIERAKEKFLTTDNLDAIISKLKENDKLKINDHEKIFINELLRKVIYVAWQQSDDNTNQENLEESKAEKIKEYNRIALISLTIKLLDETIKSLDERIREHENQLKKILNTEDLNSNGTLKDEAKKIQYQIKEYEEIRKKIEYRKIQHKIEEYTGSLKPDLLNDISEIRLKEFKELREESIKIYNFDFYQNEVKQFALKANKLRNEITPGARISVSEGPLSSREKSNKTFEDIKDWGKLAELQKLAVAISYILGQWLADAIALVVDIYGAREVQLGGGPLAGYTGIFVTTAARMALEKAYGFDIKVVLPSEQQPASSTVDIPSHRSKSRDLKSLRLIYPPFDSGVGGARGAAKAALEEWVQFKTQAQLLSCRDFVVQTKKPGDSFTAHDVLEKLIKEEAERFIEKEDIEAMLVTESESLSLTRTAKSKFKKL